MGWGTSWDMDEQKQNETHTYHFITKDEPKPLTYLGSIQANDNLVFICDACDCVYDPGISGFQALINAARKDGWLIKFHIDKAGYAMICPKCKS